MKALKIKFRAASHCQIKTTFLLSFFLPCEGLEALTTFKALGGEGEETFNKDKFGRRVCTARVGL